MDKEKTKVLFRKWKEDDEVIALFPEEVGTSNPYTCMSYEHMGQHGAATEHHVTGGTKPAREFEYRELFNELSRIGYNLQVIPYRSASWLKHFNMRKAKLEQNKS